MSNTSKAVFLSYASQDADAARAICEALRGAGVEVWFDQAELRGGDVWDQKIRRQIKDCALFVPVISPNTNARPEGYFRLEWKLAVDRSYLMADDQAFIVPVAIGDAVEATARVPDRFREVQWTRLRLDETPTEFGSRVRRLLAVEPAAVESAVPAGAGRPTQRRKWRVSLRWWMLAPLVGIGLALFYLLRPWWPSGAAADDRPKSAANAPAPVSEARQLAAKARALFEPWDGATREDFALAEQLLKRAVDRDPADGEAWGTYGLMMCGQIVLGYERADGRLELVRSATERAVKLAPESNTARLAQAFYFRFNDTTKTEAERMLRGIIERAPTDKLALRTLGAKLRNDGKTDEALSYFDRAAALPGGDPVAVYNKYLTLWRAARMEEAERVLDAALATTPAPYLYRAKVQSLLHLHGDLDGAARMLTKVSPAYLLEDAGICTASQVWLWRREPERCLALVQSIARPVIEHDLAGPRAFLAGIAYRMAGRNEAAQTEFRAALQVSEQQLAAEPNARRWIYWKCYLLALLGQKTEAAAALQTFEQLAGLTSITDDTVPVYLLLGRHEVVIAGLEHTHKQILATGNTGLRAAYENMLRYDPAWEPIRSHPRVQRLWQSRTGAIPEAPAH